MEINIFILIPTQSHTKHIWWIFFIHTSYTLGQMNESPFNRFEQLTRSHWIQKAIFDILPSVSSIELNQSTHINLSCKFHAFSDSIKFSDVLGRKCINNEHFSLVLKIRYSEQRMCIASFGDRPRCLKFTTPTQLSKIKRLGSSKSKYQCKLIMLDSNNVIMTKFNSNRIDAHSVFDIRIIFQSRYIFIIMHFI